MLPDGLCWSEGALTSTPLTWGLSPAQDAPRRHPVSRGPEPWLEAPPESDAPALAAQEALLPAARPRPPRCGVPDPPEGLNARNRQKRFVLSGGRWEKTDLTYR